jgi:hypothetical protein
MLGIGRALSLAAMSPDALWWLSILPRGLQARGFFASVAPPGPSKTPVSAAATVPCLSRSSSHCKLGP